MMRSMFTGVAGLKTHQQKMDVIGNNIANVNTVGFKSGSVTFKEIFSQNLQGASAPNADTGRGGTNPMQVGLGVTIGSIDNVMSQGAAQTTDNPLDLMINGNSFFIVGDGDSMRFTRDGSFRLDVDGNLVNAAGLKVYGWQGVLDEENPGQMKIEKGKVSPLKIRSAENLYIDAEATTAVAYEGNLNIHDGLTEDGIIKNFDFYDSLGNHYRVDMSFKYAVGAKTWSFSPASTMVRNGLSTIPFRWDHLNCQLTFDSNGRLETVDSTADSFIEFEVLSDLGLNAKTEKIKLDFSGLTQFNSITSAKGLSKNGSPPGEMTGFSVGQDGIITGTYSNGHTKKLGQLSVANFKNPAALEKAGNNLFATTPNSGNFDGIGDDPTYGGGSIGGSRLEMSNVQLAKEFTEMITTQRGFQANSKVITTSDEILQELVRLK